MQGDKIRWWPIYSSDLEDEPVGRIQLSMDYSSIPVEIVILSMVPLQKLWYMTVS